MDRRSKRFVCADGNHYPPVQPWSTEWFIHSKRFPPYIIKESDFTFVGQGLIRIDVLHCRVVQWSAEDRGQRSGRTVWLEGKRLHLLGHFFHKSRFSPQLQVRSHNVSLSGLPKPHCRPAALKCDHVSERAVSNLVHHHSQSAT